MQKWILLPCLWMLITISTAWSQTDTSRVRLLNEVTIQSSSNKDQIGFYQSSKLATTEEILSKIEGVNLISRGQYAMEPTLRSYSANQINLSIDGMRIYGACTDKMDPVSVYVEPINLQGISVAHGAKATTMEEALVETSTSNLNRPTPFAIRNTLLNLYNLIAPITRLYLAALSSKNRARQMD
jgi:hypothetical protein